MKSPSTPHAFSSNATVKSSVLTRICLAKVQNLQSQRDRQVSVMNKQPPFELAQDLVQGASWLCEAVV